MAMSTKLSVAIHILSLIETGPQEQVTSELEREIFNIHQNPNPNCSVGANIQSVLETEFTKVQQKMEEELKSITLADVIHEIEVKRDK